MIGVGDRADGLDLRAAIDEQQVVRRLARVGGDDDAGRDGERYARSPPVAPRSVPTSV